MNTSPDSTVRFVMAKPSPVGDSETPEFTELKNLTHIKIWEGERSSKRIIVEHTFANCPGFNIGQTIVIDGRYASLRDWRLEIRDGYAIIHWEASYVGEYIAPPIPSE